MRSISLLMNATRYRLPALAVVLTMATAAWAQVAQPQALQTIPLRAGFHAIKAQLARTPDQRQLGLMHRKTMPVHEGMLFVFDEASVQCFWMKNTLLPLSIAFLGDDGRIVNIDEMQPQTLEPHCSTEPVRYVLEMNALWFTQRGLKAGDRIEGGPFDSDKASTPSKPTTKP
jgi:uncharacterized protein